MSLARRLAPWITATLTSDAVRDLRRAAAEARRRLARAPHRVLWFHQVDDPYSHLGAQVLAPLLERYAIELVPRLVGAPPDDAAPERERLVAFARKDAADVAPFYGLSFPRDAAQPAPDAVAPEVSAPLPHALSTTARLASKAVRLAVRACLLAGVPGVAQAILRSMRARGRRRSSRSRWQRAMRAQVQSSSSQRRSAGSAWQDAPWQPAPRLQQATPP